MKLIRVKKVDEDQEILNELEQMSKFFVLPAYNFPNRLEINFAGEAFSNIEKSLNYMKKMSDKVSQRISEAQNYLKETRSKVLQLQSEVKNKRVFQ